MTYKLAQGLSDGRYPNWHHERYSNYSGRFQPGLDSPLIINSRTTLNASIDLGGSRSRGFWGGFLDGLMGRNAYGIKTGIGILDIAAFWAMGKLMGTSRTTPTGSSWFGGTGLYTGSSGSLFANNNLLGSGIGDSFSLANSSYTSYTPTGATPAAAAPDTKAKPAANDELDAAGYKELLEKTDPTEAEKAKMKAYQKAHADDAKKAETEIATAKKKTKPADAKPAVQNNGENNTPKVISADDFNEFVDDITGNKKAIIKNSAITTEDVSNSDNVDNLEAIDKDGNASSKNRNGYYEHITITDKSGNKYTLHNPKVDGNVLTYTVESVTIDKNNTGKYNENEKFKKGTKLKITINASGMMEVINHTDQPIVKTKKQ